MQIVTNGRVFRIQEDDGKFVQTYISIGPSSGSYGPWQTRSYIKALRRYGQLMKGRMNQLHESKWEPL